MCYKILCAEISPGESGDDCPNKYVSASRYSNEEDANNALTAQIAFFEGNGYTVCDGGVYRTDTSAQPYQYWFCWGHTEQTCAYWGCDQIDVNYWLDEEIARAIAPITYPGAVECDGENCDAADGCYTVAFDDSQPVDKWGVYLCKGAASSSAVPSSSSAAAPSSSSAAPVSSSSGSTASCPSDLCFTVESDDVEQDGNYLRIYNISDADCACFPDDEGLVFCVYPVFEASEGCSVGCTSHDHAALFDTEELAQGFIDEIIENPMIWADRPWGDSTPVICGTTTFELLGKWGFQMCWKFAPLIQGGDPGQVGCWYNPYDDHNHMAFEIFPIVGRPNVDGWFDDEGNLITDTLEVCRC